MALDHKTSHKSQFSEHEIYTSSGSWINHIPLMYGLLGQYLAEIQLFENLESVQKKFLSMHITNQKLSFDMFMIGNSLNILMEHDLYLMS